MTTHCHACVRCGHEWVCLLPLKGKQRVCDVMTAIKVNKGGPFCLLCQHIIMAKRLADNRLLTDQALAAL